MSNRAAIETLQRLHAEAERACREWDARRDLTTDPRAVAHLGGRVVGIRQAMAALGAAEVMTDTGVCSLADELPRGWSDAR